MSRKIQFINYNDYNLLFERISSIYTQILRSRLFAYLFTFGAVIIVWQGLAMLFPEDLFPFPLDTFVLIFKLIDEGIVMRHLKPTFIRTVLGFIFSLCLGIIIGVPMGLSNRAKEWLVPYVMIGISISGLSSAAIAMLIFGFELTAPVLATGMAVFPYISINIWKAVENLDRNLLNMSRSFDVSNYRLTRRVILPEIAPALFASFRFGLATSWKIVTVAELFAATKGIGYKILQTYSGVKFDEAWAWGLIFVILILVIEFGIFRPLEQYVFGYRPELDLEL